MIVLTPERHASHWRALPQLHPLGRRQRNLSVRYFSTIKNASPIPQPIILGLLALISTDLLATLLPASLHTCSSRPRSDSCHWAKGEECMAHFRQQEARLHPLLACRQVRCRCSDRPSRKRLFLSSCESPGHLPEHAKSRRRDRRIDERSIVVIP